MLAVVQAIAGRVGAVAKSGLEDCVRKSYGPVWALVVLASVIFVNILTLAADLEGGAAALSLLSGLDYRWFVIPLAALVALWLTFSHYETIKRWLLVLPLVFLAYIASAVMAHPDWGAVLRSSFIPHLAFTRNYVAGAVALLGTTLTAYAYVWETVEVAHERPPLRQLGLVQAEAIGGIVVAGIVFWFIIVATGATLGVHHQVAQTAQDAAQALAPFAGRYASLLFGIGLLGSALIAVPVIAGTSAYVMAEAFGWRRSLDASFARARKFYLALCLSLGLGAAIGMAGVPPITLLFASSIAGGIATPLTMAFLMLVAMRSDVMRGHRLSPALCWAGWGVTGVVTFSVLAFFVQTAIGGGS